MYKWLHMADSQHRIVFVRVWVATAGYKKSSAIKIKCYCLQSKDCVTQKLYVMLFKFDSQKGVSGVRVHLTSPRLFGKRVVVSFLVDSVVHVFML